jgi:hypothetical protein
MGNFNISDIHSAHLPFNFRYVIPLSGESLLPPAKSPVQALDLPIYLSFL